MVLNYFKSLKDNFNVKNIFGKQLVDTSTSNYIQSVFDHIEDGSLKVETLTKSTSKLDKELASYLTLNKDGEKTVEDFNKHLASSGESLTKLSVTSKAAKIGMTALNATLTFGASLLASFAIEGIISWFDDMIHKSEKLAEAAEKSIEKVQELKDEFQSNQQFINDNAQRFAELSQGVGEFGNNKSLSVDGYTEFLSISNQLAEIFPALSRTYDDNGNAIIKLDGNVDDIVNSLQKLIEVQRDLSNTNIAAELPTIFQNASDKSAQYEQNTEELKRQRDIVVESIDYLNSANITQALDNQWIDVQDVDTRNLYKIKDAYVQAFDEIKVAYEEMPFIMGVDEYGMEIPVGFSLHITNELDNDTKTRIQSAVSDILGEYEDEVENIDNQIKGINKQHEQTWNSLNQSIASWLYTNSDYKVLDDNTQAVIQQMVDSVQWSQLDFSNWEQARSYIQNQILNVFTSDVLSSQLKARLLKSLQQGSLSDNDYIATIQKLQSDINAYFREHGIEIELNLDFLIADKADTEQRLQSRIRELVKSPEDNELAEQFMISANIDTLVEKEAFLDAASGVNTLNEAFVNYNATLAQTNEEIKNLDAINEGLDKIQGAYQTVSGAVKEYRENNALSLDTVQSLLSLDDEYLQVLYDENGQLTLNTNAYKELAKARLYDLYAKLASETANMVESLDSEETATKELEESIDDLIIAKKEDIEAGILQAETALLNAQISNEDITNRKALLDKIKNQYALLNTMSDSLSYENFWGDNDSNNSGSSNNKFEAEINWIDNSLENINREIDAINDKIADTRSLKDRIKLYEELNAANQKLVNATSKAAKEYEREWTKASSKISNEYKQKIMSGGTFNIEEFSDETLYQNVKTALDAYKAWQSSIQTQNDALAKQKEDQNRHIQDLLEQEEIKLELNDLDKEDAQTAKEKNSLLYKENKILAEILKYNLQLAETEEEKLRYKQEYNQALEENKKLIYENNQSELGNKASYYDSRIQDIQNDIDLEEAKGGQGTEEQYLEMNDYYERQKEIYEFMYDNALDARNNPSVVYGSDEWEYYNQQIQDAENNINQCTIAQIENNRAILLLPVKQYEDLNAELQRELDLQSQNRERIENAISYASTLVQDQIDLLDKNKESITDYYDAQIKPLEEQKEALTKTNDEIQRQMDLENAKYNLERALNNKTSRIYRAGEGFVYEANQDDVRAAQQELDNQIYENEIASLDSAIDTLNKQKDTEIETIDKKIEAWEEYANNIDKVTSSYERFVAMQDFITVFGAGAIEQVLSQDTSILTNFESTLNTVKTKEDELKAKIDANALAIQAIQREANAYISGSKDIVEARKKIDEIVVANQDEIEAIGARTTVTGEYAKKWTGTEKDIITALGNVESANITAKDNEKTTLEEREENLESFKNKAIGYYDEIASAVTSAQSSLSTLQGLLSDAKTTYDDIVAYNNKINGAKSSSNKDNQTYVVDGGKVSTYHDGGIVGKNVGSKKLPDLLMSLADSPLQPNETLAKLLNGEIVLNNGQMNNLFSNLSKASIPSAINATNKSSGTAMNVSIGDVNVYNPDNSDMIVNEIVKELPLKVIQKLNSK